MIAVSLEMSDEPFFLGKDILAEPQLWKTTDKSGTASFLLEAKDWF